MPLTGSTGITQVIALVHADLHDNDTLALLDSSSACILKVEPPKRKDFHVSCQTLHKRTSGKVVKSVSLPSFFYCCLLFQILMWCLLGFNVFRTNYMQRFIIKCRKKEFKSFIFVQIFHFFIRVSKQQLQWFGSF